MPSFPCSPHPPTCKGMGHWAWLPTAHFQDEHYLGWNLYFRSHNIPLLSSPISGTKRNQFPSSPNISDLSPDPSPISQWLKEIWETIPNLLMGLFLVCFPDLHVACASAGIENQCCKIWLRFSESLQGRNRVSQHFTENNNGVLYFRPLVCRRCYWSFWAYGTTSCIRFTSEETKVQRIM